MKHCGVTTFSPEAWPIYGERFVLSWIRHVDAPLLVFHEGMEVPSVDPKVVWVDVTEDVARNQWLSQHQDPKYHGDPSRPNRQAIRFSHKVWAVTSGQRPDCEWWLWFDADVEFFKHVGEREFARLCPDDKSISYLGRSAYAYSECGFVGYRTGRPEVRNLLADMRTVYLSGELFTWPPDDWHDSKCFDRCRKRSGIPESSQHNLSERIRGTINVWPLTVLGEVSHHHKGPGRKLAAYGQVPQNADTRLRP